MTVARQTAVSYTFDNADRLTGVTRGTAAVTIAYDRADKLTSLTLPNGGVTRRFGHGADRLYVRAVRHNHHERRVDGQFCLSSPHDCEGASTLARTFQNDNIVTNGTSA
jgi:YD repeat-containing protein